MADFPVDVAQMVGLFMECILYGVYLVTFGMCMRALLSKRTANASIKYHMVLVSLLMFTFATLDVAFGLRHNLEAFIYYKGPGGAIGEFGIESNWVNVMKTADYVAQTAIGDGILVYRCYMVYNKRWIIVSIPAILWLATSVCSVITIEIEATLRQNAFLNERSLTPFITSTLILTLVLNILTTSLIVYKIYTVNRNSTSFQSRSNIGSTTEVTQLGQVMRIIIESGLIYTLSVVITVATHLSASNAQYGVSDSVVQIIGIVFNLIIIRVDQGATSEFTSYSSGHTSMSFRQPPFPLHFPGRRESQSVGLTSSIDSPVNAYGKLHTPMEPDAIRNVEDGRQQRTTESFDCQDVMEMSDRDGRVTSDNDFTEV